MQLIFAFPESRKDDFSTFVVDENNDATVKLCRQFAAGQIAQQKRSLVLYGAAGSGKTHLLTAIGTLWQGGLYLDGATLKEEVLASQTYEQLKNYLARFSGAPLLVVDHLEAIEGDEAAEEQLFHLYNDVIGQGGFFIAAIYKRLAS